MWKLVWIALFLVWPAPAMAQVCPTGWDLVQAGCPDVGEAGCCDEQGADSAVVRCHQGVLTCKKTCGGGAVSAKGACCNVHSGGGCCNQAVEDCVCNLDLFCCLGSWDVSCSNAAQQCSDDACAECPGSTPSSCGWTGAQYDCADSATADPSGGNPLQCGPGGGDDGTADTGTGDVGTADTGTEDTGTDDGGGSTTGGSTGGGCVPSCANKGGGQKQCGSDGCNGSCGVCQPPSVCDVDSWQCLGGGGTTEGCTPDCRDKQCGPDGCDGICGECSDDKGCIQGTCVDASTDAGGVDGASGSDFATGFTAGQTGTDAGGTTDGGGTDPPEDCGPDHVMIYGDCIAKDQLIGDAAGAGGGQSDSGCSAAPAPGGHWPFVMWCLLLAVTGARAVRSRG